MAVIEGLKAELEECKNELSRYKEGNIPAALSPTMNAIGSVSGQQSPEMNQRNWSRFRSNKGEGPLGAVPQLTLEEKEKLYEDLQSLVKLDNFDPKAK